MNRARDRHKEVDNEELRAKRKANKPEPARKEITADTALPPEVEAKALTNPSLASSANLGRKAQVLQSLQRTHGNAYVQRLVMSREIQTKLTVNQPDDEYEKEADQIADTVAQISDSQVQRQEEEEEEIQTKAVESQLALQRQVDEEEEEEEEEIQTKAVGSQATRISKGLEMRVNAARGGGDPLPEPVRAFFEPRFGHDFGQVHIHTDTAAAETAQQINARAYTVGRDIVIGAGQYSPETTEGRRLLAHELTHVIQQEGFSSAGSTLEGAKVQRQRKRKIKDIPFELPPVPAQQAAVKLRQILRGRMRVKNKRKKASPILDPKRGKEWLRAVEKNYNHQLGWFTVMNYEGTPQEYAHLEQKGKPPLQESFLRIDLQTSLGPEATDFIDALEAATRFKGLKPAERAEAILSEEQRRIATERAKGPQLELAKWLFGKKNWTYFVANAARWAQGELAGFFELPTDKDRIEWPSKKDDPQEGDKVYLDCILGNLLNLRKEIDRLIGDVCAVRAAVVIGPSPEHTKAIQFAAGMRVMEYREKLFPLLGTTGDAVKKLIPFEIIWGPRPKDTAELCRRIRK